MKKQWFRLCCLILVIVMTVNSLPLTVFAEEYQSSKTTPLETSTVTEQSEQLSVDYANAQIVEENVDSRTVFSKEFLLDNGVSLAVLYDSAVHYEKDGKWEEIDNTLQAKSNGTLTNKAGIWDVAFPQQLSSSNQISITKDGYTLSFGMAGELRQQGNLEVMSTGEAASVNGNNEPTPTIAPEKGTVVAPSTEATIPEETTPVATTSDDLVSKETIPQETEPNVVVPVEGTLEVVAPEEIVTVENEQEVIPQESTAEETEPVETIPPETIPEETTPVETIPAETIPKESTQEEIIPEETVSEMTELPKPDENAPTASVMINGTVQTFAVSAMNTARGQIQTVDRKEVLEAAEHEETVLEKPVSKLLYADVYTNTDVQYDLVGNQVKESIIMDSYNDTLRGYQFRLNTGKLVPVLAADNHIDFYDESKENIVMVMPAPYLVDNELVRCDDVQVHLSGADGIYLLTYVLPQQWLADEERAWPVVLDPVIEADIHVTNIRDRSIAQKFSPNYQYEINQVGVGLSYGAYRSFVQYSNLPALTSSDVILKATISMKKYSSYSSSGVVEVHKVYNTWSSTASMNWNTMPNCDDKVEDYVQLGSSTWYTWDITDIARGWYAGANTGMMFKVPDTTEAQTSTASWVQFYSSDNYAENRPSMEIYFRNNNGLESYWDYTSSSAGRAGTGHINQYTGNLVWVHNDLGFGGNRMPVSISHVYNANDTSVTQYGMGNGWRTNFNQRVYQWTSNTNYYIWEDADGTKHYFLKASTGVYKDEDGLELTLTNTGSGTTKFCITDKYGNKSYFDTSGRLTQQVNNQATPSSITVAYKATSGYLIQTIADGAGRKYNFEYNSSNLLNKITYVGTGSSEITSVSYGYTSSNLTSVTYKDGKKATFAYGANNLLTSATDIDGYALKFEYNTTTAGQPSRVSKISEFDGSAAGGVMNYEYAHNQTTCTDHNGNVQILQFNNMGNTVCIQDGEGHAQYAKYAKNDTEESGKGNQLTASSKLQNTVGNLLTDSSFENSTLWTAASGSRSIASSGYLGSKSLAVTGGRSNSAAFTVASGESCTFSAYVKTTGSGATLALYSGSSAVATQSFPVCSNWTRVEVNYTNTSSSSKSLNAAIQSASGQTVYVDCVQVEKAPTASRYNLVQNGDFNFSGSPAQYWTASGTASTDVRTSAGSKAAPQLDTNVIKLVGNPMGTKKLSQTIPVSGAAGDTYVVAGWAQADSVPLEAMDTRGREFGIRLVFVNTDGTTTPVVAQFNPDTNTTANWQYSAAAAVAAKAYSSIRVEVAYDYNANTAYFDGIQLFKEQFGQSYAYDANGNVTSVVDLQKQQTRYEYTNNNLTKEILPTGATLTYVYDNYHNVTQATTDTGVVYKFTYDTYGNNTSVSIGSGSTVIKSTASYSTDGNRMTSATDATGKTTYYDYDVNTNVLNSVKYPEDSDSTKTNYTYDSMYRMATAAATTDTDLTLSANYTYTDDMLTKIQTGSTTYNFVYGDFALRNSVKIGSRTLANYTYTSQNNYLDTLAYGNGDSVKYTYDQQGRVTKQTYEDGDTVTYRYDNDGALATVTDSATGITTTYYYDFIDRMMKYVETGSGHSHSVGYAYDTINNLTQMVETINGTAHTTSYTYDDDNRVTKVTNGTVEKQNVYDAYGRLATQTTKQNGVTVQTETFTYTNPTATTTSAQIKTHTINSAGHTVTYTYTYDNNGNILTVSDGTKTTSYVYDSANQLTRENNQAGGFTHTWTYDNAGNILSRKEYAYTTGALGAVLDTVTYGYNDSSWGDLLTAVDSYIHYDAIGNPLNNEDDSRSYTWEHGRELASMAISSEFAIISQPEDCKCLPTGRAYFNVEAAGTDLSYRWQWFNGSTWINSTATGVTTNSMSVGAAGENGTIYRCVVTDGEGNVAISDSVKVVHVPIMITSQPTDWWGTASERAAFTVQVSSTDPNLTYQWQWRSGSTWINSQATGVTTNSMSVGAAGENGTTYRCYITDSAGNVAISDSVTVHTDPLGFITQPEDSICSPSGRAYFSVEAYGTNLSYQWQWHSPGSDTWANSYAVGAQTNAINLGVSGENGTVYRCVITDGAGNVAYSEPATVIPYAIHWDYTYDANGLRTRRTNGAVSYDYIYNGSSLTQLSVTDEQNCSTTVLDISYDAGGKPMSLSYNGTRYIYATNIQGDVIAILDTSGAAIVEYTYDAWGNILSTTGSMASTLGAHNPLRYRGYVYDQEYGLYYLQSRYYNPETGRFLNADAFAATGQGLLGNNMFCYCGNNPVMCSDPSGNIRVSILEKEIFHVPVTKQIPANSPEDQVYGIVNGQELLSYADERIGLGSYGNSGCAYIAAYNALQLVGKGKPLSAVTNEIYCDYGTVLFGAFGVAPATLAVYLRDQGIVSVESANLNTLVNGITDGSVITFTAWNNSRNPFGGWHAMTALYTNGEYLVFNRYSDNPEALPYSNLSSAIQKGAFLYGVRIDPQ